MTPKGRCENRTQDTKAVDKSFARQPLFTMSIGLLLLLAWRLGGLITVALGAVVLSIALRGLARILSRLTRINDKWAVVPVILLLVGFLSSVSWLFGAQIGSQFDVLVERMPQMISTFQHDLGERAWGRWLVNQAQDVNLPNATGAIAGRIGAFFSSTLRGVAYAAVLIAGGVYFATQPERYRQGLLQLVPPRRRARAAAILNFAGDTLQRWLMGQSLSMLAVGLLTTLGLWGLGVNAPVALGLISATFAFVPYVGPLAAAVPAIAMALTQSPRLALYTMLLYACVHLVEGNIITPLVQNEAVHLPPALTIFAAAVFGVLLGPIGVLLAAPLTILLLVGVQTLYIEDVLRENRTWP